MNADGVASAAEPAEPAEQRASLRADARELATTQRDIARDARWIRRRFVRPPLSRPLERLRRQLVGTNQVEAKNPKATEWFLDNYYLLRRIARQVEEELPPGFLHRLPRLREPSTRGRPRVDQLARAIVVHTELVLGFATLRSFIDAYQEVEALTIAELWALPTMLRTAALERLLSSFDALGVSFDDADRRDFQLQGGRGSTESSSATPTDPEVGVERAIHALRVLDAIDWKIFFEKSSRVEAILRTDPAGVYGRMEFETSDSYRKAVELLAWGTGRTEAEVATHVVELAAETPDDARLGHVGYHLVAEGRPALEQRLGYRAAGLEWLRSTLLRWPTLSFLLPLTLLTWLPPSLVAWRVGVSSQGSLSELAPIALALFVALVPLSTAALTLLHFVFARILSPRTLPKLDFEAGLPAEARTLIVIPTLLGRPDDVATMLRQVELHYLANPDPSFRFALLTDHVDTRDEPTSSRESSLLDQVARGVDALNLEHGEGGVGPFHLLHRESRWNPSEERYMGWERKRGKLEELNRLLRGDETTSYVRHVGEPEGLLGIRYVITLDSDTQLPIGSARRLVGVLAHPLNRASFDEATGRVVAGYTIVQPRVDTSPSDARRSRFSRIFAGDVGFDIYTHASSELYQDLFGSGIYVGKGIYDVDAFMRSVEGAAPENALVSHDLFEGIHGRTALATDIVLFESYPSSYATYAMRLHRWLRGDWQLLPWLLRGVSSTQRAWPSSRLVAIDRWKIADNLRRSLWSPCGLALLLIAWLWPQRDAAAWTLAALALLMAPTLPAVLGNARMRAENLSRSALAVAFLPYEAALALDAIARVAVRKLFTGKHLLEWVSAAHADRRFAAEHEGLAYWKRMIASPLVAVAASAVVAWWRPSSLFAAAPLLLLWSVAPAIARRISRVEPERAQPSLGEAELRKLRLLARRTWGFFDAFAGPTDQWLPIDNHQEHPYEQTAHRTSPTNIGLMLVSTLTAYDLGYIGLGELTLRLRRACDSIGRMAHYQGHLLNWYDSRNLQPLAPRYVSTVDSGNLAGCLLALEQGLRELVRAPVLRPESWDGLADAIALLDEVVEALPDGPPESLVGVVHAMRGDAQQARDHLEEAYVVLRRLRDERSAELDRELLEWLRVGHQQYEPDLLHALRTAVDRLRQQTQHLAVELEARLPWLALEEDALALGLALPAAPELDAIPEAAAALERALDARMREHRRSDRDSSELEAAACRLREALRRGAANAEALTAELLALAGLANREALRMDFGMLYDRERKLFRIGYNATIDKLDAHHYDLLASEARLASYFAIVKGDVPTSHWYALGRPMTQVSGVPTLLSWGGTMFEYLMPTLLMRSREGTLLARTSEQAIEAQIADGARTGGVWGISESAYARLDGDHTYQYRSFGAPGLGFRRGLEDDRVLTPYASMLGIGIRPRAVYANLLALEARGMMGTYGLYEALDATPERALQHAPAAEPFAVVKVYMAHHQGMILVALGNLLSGRSMVDRFHSSPLVQMGEVLLNEHAPRVAPEEWPLADGGRSENPHDTSTLHPAPAPWPAPEGLGPQAFVLSNGRLSTVLTASGGGALHWRGTALTRYEADPSRDQDGLWFHLRDEETGEVWLATSNEGRASFAMHKAELHLRKHGISVHVEVGIAAGDDVEVRRVTLHDESNRPRRISVTSAGRPVLLDARQAPSHPAFSSLFVTSEPLRELDGLVFARRAQSAEEQPVVLVHRLVREGKAVRFAGSESDRSAFYGRGGSRELPLSLVNGRGSLEGTFGAVLDPTMSLMAQVELEPMGTTSLAFVTSVARSRGGAVELARKYGSMHAVRWAFRDAEQESRRRLRRSKIEPELLPTAQRLFSVIHYGLYTQPAAAALEPPCQARLWSWGISGDDPIVVVRVEDPSAPVLAEVLGVQRFLRACGVRLDLVLVDEQASGYVTDGSGSLRKLLADSEADPWINRKGGVYVIAADQVPKSELLHLEACARIVFDTRAGSLAPQLARPLDPTPQLPRFEGTLAALIAPPFEDRPSLRPELSFDNGVGGFSTDGREYVLQVSAGAPPPAPWCNVMANPELGCILSESSLGATWSLNSGENRLTPWRNDPVFDTPSEALYLRDEETAVVWTPTPLPAGRESATLVRHGAGYTSYERESQGLSQELTVFVPPDAGLKIVRLRLKNALDRPRRVTATYYAEWVLGKRREGQSQYIASELDRAHACLMARSSWSAEFGARVAFLASHHDVHGCTSDRGEFLGQRGDFTRPEGLERWGLSGRVGHASDPCGALQVHLDLPAGGAIETHFVLGQAANRDEALALVSRFRAAEAVEAAWKRTKEHWDAILGSIEVQTPDPAMNLMLNRWLSYQALSSRIYGRTGFYQSSGAFGYRDQLQDVMAFLHASPALARAHIVEAARHQFEAGDVLHWWHPPSGRGVRTRCSDDLAWLPYVTAEYVAATGDDGVLDEQVPFIQGDELRPDERDRYAEYPESPISASLFEHCRRALERAATRGAHGLPLMGDGDWNDGMSRIGAQGRGESVWLGWFLSATMHRFGALCRRRGDGASAARWAERAAELRKTTEDVGWDGAWYLRAFHDDGSRVGSSTSKECRIDSLTQSWAALSMVGGGTADARTFQAVRSAEQHLVRENDRLVLLFTPPFDSLVHDPGYVRAYPPGVRENGGQYTHAGAWLGLALAALGDGEAAERTFRLLNPILRSRSLGDARRYRLEPYVVAGDIYGAAPWVGRGGWSWYTGSASWLWRLGVEGILGLRKREGRLVVDPCIPPSWRGYEAWVQLGSARVHVVVDNPKGVARGVFEMTLDGVPVVGGRIDVDPSRHGTHELAVLLGSSAAPRLEPSTEHRSVAG